MPAFDFHKYRKEQKNRSKTAQETKQSEESETVQQCTETAPSFAAIPLDTCGIQRPLEDFRVGSVPAVYYVPEFLSKAAEAVIQENVRKNEWVQLKTRRLQYYGGVPSTRIELEQLPDWLDALCTFLVDARVFAEQLRPNHVLVNEYLPGEGIMGHSDGPLYHGRVAILSTGEATTMVFRKRLTSDQIGESLDSGDVGSFSLVLQPRSLLVFTENAYVEWLHEIPARDVDVVGSDGDCVNAQLAGVEHGGTIERQVARVSLTVRHVPPASREV